MQQRIVCHWLLVAILGLAIEGCKSESAGLPKDPLLTSKRPIRGNVNAENPVRLAYAEPSPPPLPEVAFVGSSLAPRAVTKSSQPSVAPEIPHAVTEAPSPGKAPVEVKAVPVARRKWLGTYGHAPDHSWLQGVLETQGTDTMCLRYSASPAGDNWGGRVSLQDDARLAQLKDGDVVLVEGEMVQETGESESQTRRSCPVYRIHDVWLVQRRD